MPSFHCYRSTRVAKYSHTRAHIHVQWDSNRVIMLFTPHGMFRPGNPSIYHIEWVYDLTHLLIGYAVNLSNVLCTGPSVLRQLAATDLFPPISSQLFLPGRQRRRFFVVSLVRNVQYCLINNLERNISDEYVPALYVQCFKLCSVTCTHSQLVCE